jgi:hypothetical protein
MPDILNNRLLIRRITSVKAIRNTQRDLIGYKAECNHSVPPETKVFPLSQWGSIAYELAEDWALNHKCRGDYNHSAIAETMKEIVSAPTRKLHSVVTTVGK